MTIGHSRECIVLGRRSIVGAT